MKKVVIIKSSGIIRVYNKKEFEKYKNRNYVTESELQYVNLMQFLMQREEKTIKNEEKRIKETLKNSEKMLDFTML